MKPLEQFQNLRGQAEFEAKAGQAGRLTKIERKNHGQEDINRARFCWRR
jgi:hypothetical protein